MENEVFSRSWKRQQSGFSPETSRKNAGLLALQFSPLNQLCISDHINVN